MKFNFKFKNLEFLLIASILILAAFLRLYRISDYLTFLGDEGRDVLIAKGILEGHLTLLGPRASAGDFFLGPIYYYFIAPFLWLFKLDPVGPAVMVALLSIATVFLIYKVSKEFFGVKAAFFSSALYAVSPLVIAYSRSSWNPNPMPFVSLLTLYLAYKTVLKPSWKKFIIIGVLLGIAIQLHYLSTFLIVIVLVFILIANRYKKVDFKKSLIWYFQILLGFLIGFSPFLIFEARHDFPNTRTIIDFVFSNTFQKSYEYNTSFIEVVKDVIFRLFGRLVLRFPAREQLHTLYQDRYIFILQAGTLFLIAESLFNLFKIKNKLAFLLLITWFSLGVLLFGFYKKPIYDYYFGFMFPLPFMLVGNFLANFPNKHSSKTWGKAVAFGVFLAIFIFNLYGNPFRYEPNRQKDQVKKISQFLLSKTDNRPFNFALITAYNSDHAYRYYFDILGKPPIPIENIINDTQRKTVTDQLLIVCEDTECKPLGYPLFEISNFGRAEIAGEWNVSVVKVFKLVHYKGK